jgi:hypothetical protein
MLLKQIKFRMSFSSIWRHVYWSLCYQHSREAAVSNFKTQNFILKKYHVVWPETSAHFHQKLHDVTPQKTSAVWIAKWIATSLKFAEDLLGCFPEEEHVMMKGLVYRAMRGLTTRSLAGTHCLPPPRVIVLISWATCTRSPYLRDKVVLVVDTLSVWWQSGLHAACLLLCLIHSTALASWCF